MKYIFIFICTLTFIPGCTDQDRKNREKNRNQLIALSVIAYNESNKIQACVIKTSSSFVCTDEVIDYATAIVPDVKSYCELYGGLGLSYLLTKSKCPALGFSAAMKNSSTKDFSQYVCYYSASGTPQCTSDVTGLIK